MKHLKKYSEIETINEVSKELASRAAKLAMTKSDDFDKKNNHLQKDKLRTQHSVFMKTVLGKDLINNIKNLGFDLKIYRDSVDMYQNSDFICQIDAENIAWDGDLEISDIEETKKRRLLYLLKTLQKRLKEFLD